MTAAPEGGSETLTLIVTMVIKPEREEEFLATTRDFVDWVHANEPGTLLYVLTKHAAQDHTYVWVERYKDHAAADAHRNTARIGEALAVVRQCLDGAPEAIRLEQVFPQ
jgi:quinol monooxygenase YgiN